MFSNQPQMRPINTYPAWKYVMLALLLVLGILYAMPNLYGEDPALMVTGEKGGPLAEEIYQEVKQNFADNKITLIYDDLRTLELDASIKSAKDGVYMRQTTSLTPSTRLSKGLQACILEMNLLEYIGNK